ncbi:MAG: PQQ-binding-like beta-propeller repeat protein [Bryobacteraceae bacterium]
MKRFLCAVLTSTLTFSLPIFAQRTGNDWMTDGFDAQRSYWVRRDAKIDAQSMGKPGFDLVWKIPMKNQARGLNNITAPMLLDFYIGYRGFRTLGFFGGSSGNVIAVDTDIARLEWDRSFAAGSAKATALCPGGMTSAVTRPTSSGYPAAAAPRGVGRGSAAQSGVGEPLEGAVTLKNRRAPRPAPPAPPTRAARRTATAGNPFARSPLLILALAWDGLLHSMYVSNGEEPKPAVKFLPPNAHAIGLVSFDNAVYAATVNGCGGVPDGIWGLDTESGKVTNWKASAGVAGSTGFAADPDGNLYVASGKQLVVLAPGTLSQKSTASAGAAFSSSPLLFDFKDNDMVAATTADGKLRVFDSGLKEVAAADAGVGGYEVGALTSWQEEDGTRWLLVPGSKGVTAWKFAGTGLEKGWESREMVSALTPAVVSGAVFVISSGEKRDGELEARVKGSRPAVLYALDGATGKELWSSGTAMTSFVHSGGLSIGGTRVYVSTFDGTQYAFGFPIEH